MHGGGAGDRWGLDQDLIYTLYLCDHDDPEKNDYPAERLKDPENILDLERALRLLQKVYSVGEEATYVQAHSGSAVNTTWIEM